VIFRNPNDPCRFWWPWVTLKRGTQAGQIFQASLCNYARAVCSKTIGTVYGNTCMGRGVFLGVRHASFQRGAGPQRSTIFRVSTYVYTLWRRTTKNSAFNTWGWGTGVLQGVDRATCWSILHTCDASRGLSAIAEFSCSQLGMRTLCHRRVTSLLTISQISLVRRIPSIASTGINDVDNHKSARRENRKWNKWWWFKISVCPCCDLCRNMNILSYICRKGPSLNFLDLAQNPGQTGRKDRRTEAYMCLRGRYL